MGKKNHTQALLDNERTNAVEVNDNAVPKPHNINTDKTFLQYANKSLPLNKKKSRAGLTAYSGAFLDKQKIHLLRRLTFGSKLSDLAAITTSNSSNAVDNMLSKAAVAPSPPVNFYENFYQDSSQVPYGQTWVGATRYMSSTRAWRIYSLKSWWLQNMFDQDATIEEKMILFLHSHYPIEMYNSSGRPNFHYQYLDLLRTHCLGNLKDFVKALSIDGAMLWYLNGRLNTKTAPDENYARELQELFTVGTAGATYTETDVITAAKVLTGWRTREPTANNPTVQWESYFLASQHDTTTKTFSSYYNNTSVSPDNTNSAGYGANEVDDMIDMIFTHGAQDIAKLFARRIYRFFVYYDIDAATETNIIAPLAQTLINSNWEIKPMLSQLFKSDHFFDLANMDCAIKSPVDHFISMYKNLNFEIPPNATVEERYLFFHRLSQNYLRLNGQSIGDPPNVSGWPAHYQVPFFDQIWINTDTMPKRLSYTDYFLRSAGVYVKSGVSYKIDFVKLVEDIDASLSSPNSVDDPVTLVDEAVKLFLALDLSTTSKDYYKAILLSGQSSNYYWTFAWNDYKANPNNASLRNIVETRLRSMFNEMLRLPEHILS